MWSPILDGPLAHRAEEAVEATAARLMGLGPSEGERAWDLMRGDLGHALFLAYWSEASGDPRPLDRAAEIVERAMDRFSEIAHNPTLLCGFPGLGWLVEHLGERLAADDDATSPIEGALVEILDARPDWLEFELLGGVSGFAVYALERRVRTSGLLERAVAYLDAAADAHPAGVRWRFADHKLTPDERPRFPDGCYPLGPAHGAMGPMGVLAAALARGVALERARPLLEASVRSLLTLRLDAEETLFPCNAGEQTGALAWCAGDPGVAGVLHGVGRALDAPAVAEVAVEGGRRIARAIANHEDHDPSLCHGWSGIGHVLNRLGQASGEAGLRDGARLAFERLLALPDSHNRSLLTGDAGAGLALLAAVRPTEPSWDRLLLLSHG